jgi:universal stress protein A
MLFLGGKAMDEYRHLLLAVDFSPETERLAARALRLRDGWGARLSLVHVVEYLPLAYAGDLALPEDFCLDDELLDIARRRLDELGQRLGVAEADRHVALGPAAREVLRLAAAEAVDLIILGSHSRHGLALLFGSTANGVLHQARCDLLAIRLEGD